MQFGIAKQISQPMRHLAKRNPSGMTHMWFGPPGVNPQVKPMLGIRL